MRRVIFMFNAKSALLQSILLGMLPMLGALSVVPALMTPRAALAQAGCPRPPGVPPGARYSCPTHTQTQQIGEPFTIHPGGSPGRGTGFGVLPYGPAVGQPDAAQSVICQIEQDGLCHCGPRRGTGRNIPCRPDMQAPQALAPAGPSAPQQQVKHIFNYYYVNGINTPLGGNGRGNYGWDWRMIKGNLLDGDGGNARVGDVPQRGAGYQTRVRVGDEVDVLKEGTHNFSGHDRSTEAMVRDFCAGARGGFGGIAALLCPVTANGATWWDNRRASGFSGMADGDILECVLQSGPLGTGGIQFTARLPLVTDIVDSILGVYARERERNAQGGVREINYFVLVGHSQGNFFTEGIAYALGQRAGDGVHIQFRRLGILSLASPTSYDSLPPQLLGARLKHFTRADDAIVAIAPANAFLGGKTSFPPNVTRLWPWPAVSLADMLQAMSLAPPPGCFCPDPDNALYIPQLNSHLLDNYLTDPPLTAPGHMIHATAIATMQSLRPQDSLIKRGLSPATTAVLGKVRQGLADLKRELLKGE